MKFKISLLWIFVLLVYLVTSPGETPFNYFSRLADAFSNARLYINTDPLPYLSELIPIEEDKYLVPYAPFPAVLLTPFAYLNNAVVSQTFFSIIFGSLILVVTFLNSIKVSKSKKIAFFVSIFASLGTNIWFNSTVGSSWYFAQIVACLFMSLAILSKYKSSPDLLTGLLLGCAYLSRPHTILALPFFMFLEKKLDFKKIFYLNLGILPFLLFNFYYNFARFGVIWDKGYTLIPGVLEEPWYSQGIFHYSYIPRHFEALFLKLPIFINQFPFVRPDEIGMAFWVTSPLFLVLFFYKYKDRLSKLSLFTSLLIFIPISMHGAIGFAQFGYRFAIDFYPFLFVIMAIIYKERGIKRIDYFLLIVSVVMNIWGIMLG